MLLLSSRDGITAHDSGAADDPLVGVIPGDDVALHRLLLVETEEGARAAEARMRATDLASQPLEELHVTLGAMGDDGGVWLAIIGREAMAGHVQAFAAYGAEPQAIIPAPMLLPATGGTATAMLDGRLLLRSANYAASVDPALGPMFDVVAPAAPFAPAPVPRDAPNLMTGAFLPKVRWWRERGFQIAAITLALAALALLLAPFLIGKWQESRTVAEHDAATMAITSRLLGREYADAPTAAAALAQQRATRESGMLGARLTYATTVVGSTPGLRLAGFESRGDGTVGLELGGTAQAINQGRGRFTAGPFLATGDGATLLLGERRGALAPGGGEAAQALVRRINAETDAAILSATPERAAAAAGALPAARVSTALLSAGLDVRSEGDTTIVDAARPAVLLPLIATLEADGVRFARIMLTPNMDRTVRAELEPRP